MKYTHLAPNQYGSALNILAKFMTDMREYLDIILVYTNIYELL